MVYQNVCSKHVSMFTTHSRTRYRAGLEQRLIQLYTVRNPTKIPDAFSVSEEVHLCACVANSKRVCK
jgi:hypothetical protein